MKNKLKILLLEDSRMDADLLIRFLRREKFEFEYAWVWEKNAFSEQLKKLAPDLIVSDYDLPQFNGLAAFRLMKQEGFNLPFILLSGSFEGKNISQIKSEGVCDCLLKGDLSGLPGVIKKINEQQNNSCSNIN